MSAGGKRWLLHAQTLTKSKCHCFPDRKCMKYRTIEIKIQDYWTGLACTGLKLAAVHPSSQEMGGGMVDTKTASHVTGNGPLIKYIWNKIRVGKRGLWKKVWWLFNIQHPTPDLTLLSINSRNAHKYSNNCFFDSTHPSQLSKEEGKVFSTWRMKHRKSKTSLLLMTWMQILQFFSHQVGPLQSKTLLTCILKPSHTRKSLRTMQDMFFVFSSH